MEENRQETMTQSVDVIVPVYKPGSRFVDLLRRLQSQSYPVNRVIIMNTDESYWNTEYEILDQMEVHHVAKEEFDHGATRNRGAGYSNADLMVFMTDDAVPADGKLIENLVRAFSQTGAEGQRVAMVYGRQLPQADCKVIERYTRSFNYPEKSRVKTKKDLDELGIKTYFASNACCAYDRRLHKELGGFISRTIFNEDMIFAAGVIQAGYAIAYAADARVVHSHNYTNMQQFHRNFDLAVSQADHPEIFQGIKSESEGIRLVKKTAAYLIHEKKGYLIPRLIVSSGCKYLGYFAGKRYRRLPKKVVCWCSMNQKYWNRVEKA